MAYIIGKKCGQLLVGVDRFVLILIAYFWLMAIVKEK
jgi:hypothetical protein